MNNQFDICIIGAGMAGATIAAYLAPKVIKIALIDRSFSEKHRIVGELLQPGAIISLKRMGLGHLLDGFDAQQVHGYALFQGKDSYRVPYNKDESTQFYGRGMHNGRFLQKIRASALQNNTVTKIQGAVEELTEDENQVVTGVKYKDKKTREIKTIKARLTITSDGFFSSFRKDLSKNKETVTSFFIGLILTDCDLPYPNHGHVFLSGPTPFICYPISSNEIRVLVDFPGVKAPKKAAIKEHLKNCRFCQNEIRELNSINQFLSLYKNTEVPEYLNQRILASVRAISLEKNGGSFSKYVFKFSIAASVLFSFYSGILLSDIAFSSQQNSELEFGQETLYSYFEGVE